MSKMKKARKEKGLTLMQVAVKAGTYPSTISRIENGTCGVSPDLAKKLGAILGMDPAEIIFMDRAAPAAAA